MNALRKKIINTAILTLIIGIGGLLLSRFYPTIFEREAITILLIAMFIISAAVHIIIHAGD